MDFFYVTYLDRAEQTGKYPTDILLRHLDDYFIAEEYLIENSMLSQATLLDIMENQTSIFFEYKGEREFYPLLVTNDPRFYLLYKRAFTYSAFKLFCQVYDNYEALSYDEKYKVNKGKGTPTAFEYFEKLINGEGKCAYEYRKNDEWYDESESVRSMEIESGWKLI